MKQEKRKFCQTKEDETHFEFQGEKIVSLLGISFHDKVSIYIIYLY